MQKLKAKVKSSGNVIPAPGFRRGQAPAGIQSATDNVIGNTLDPRFHGGDRANDFCLLTFAF